MTVLRNRFLVNKTNRCTEFQFYWYYDSTCFGQPFCPSSGVLRCTSALVHFMQFWWPFATRSRMELAGQLYVRDINLSCLIKSNLTAFSRLCSEAAGNSEISFKVICYWGQYHMCWDQW